MFRLKSKAFFGAMSLALLSFSAAAAQDESRFTIAVIPDTQNYVDYRHQTEAGFPFDAREMLVEHLRYVADNSVSRGGDIAFVTAVGDIWQHAAMAIDPDHVARGFGGAPIAGDDFETVARNVREVEIPGAVRAFQALDGVVPFSVVPGNHDFDARWVETERRIDGVNPPQVRHLGGLTEFTRAFGAESEFFNGRSWYVDSNDGGADSAQIFTAGGYRFLHIGLQFSPPDSSLLWAERVIHAHPGLPTIVTTHQYLTGGGERNGDQPNSLIAVDPFNNHPQDVWEKFISRNDQIFMVLSGHVCCQAFREEDNARGRKVYQILADYQSRRQTRIDAGLSDEDRGGMGDGWLRLLQFDFSNETPVVHVRTYSTHYDRYASDAPQEHVQWYGAREQRGLTEEEFLQAEEFTFTLSDFRERFGD